MELIFENALFLKGSKNAKTLDIQGFVELVKGIEPPTCSIFEGVFWPSLIFKAYKLKPLVFQGVSWFFYLLIFIVFYRFF